MDRWCRDFDSWGICDTACFHLFDRTPHAWKKIGPWSRRREEFVKRAGFALLACLALHDKTATDALFLRALPRIERGAAVVRRLSAGRKKPAGKKRSVIPAARRVSDRGAKPATPAARLRAVRRATASPARRRT
jgi:hypothetical protein